MIRRNHGIRYTSENTKLLKAPQYMLHGSISSAQATRFVPTCVKRRSKRDPPQYERKPKEPRLCGKLRAHAFATDAATNALANSNQGGYTS